MAPLWFRRWGWIYRPVSFFGWSATFAAATFCVQSFVAIDRRSPSATDTLYSFYPLAVPTFLGLMWLASRTSAEAPH